jgi:hypothetical protein
VLSLQLLPRIAVVAPTVVIDKVDELIPLIEAALSKACSNVEKGERDVLKVMVKAILQLDKLDDGNQARHKWQTFLSNAKKHAVLTTLFSQLENELSESY